MRIDSFNFDRFGVRLALALCLVCPVVGAAQAANGRLYANLYTLEEAAQVDLAKNHCKDIRAGTRASSIITDAVVGLAGKVAGSLLDGIAAKFRAESATLEARSSIDGFYRGKNPALHSGCLVLHNGTYPSGEGATIIGVFQAEFSADQTAWRLHARRWDYQKFLIGNTRRWGQVDGERDFALRVLLVAPGQDASDGKASMLEYILDGVALAGIQQAFGKDEKLPWMVVPVASGSDDEKTLTKPMNLRVTIVETTKPGQLAGWLREAAADSREATVALARDMARRSLDPGYAATESVKATTAASAAYGEYKAAWDGFAKLVSEKPEKPANYGSDSKARAQYDAAETAYKAAFNAAQALTRAKGITAAGAFSAAGLAWPGDLPPFELK